MQMPYVLDRRFIHARSLILQFTTCLLDASLRDDLEFTPTCDHSCDPNEPIEMK